MWRQVAYLGDILRPQPACAAKRVATAPCLRVLLIAPYAPGGGGMGRIMSYLGERGAEGIRFDMVESRGGGPVAASVWPIAKAALLLVRVAMSGHPAVVHLNMAEGSSVLRKGLLLHLARFMGLPTLLHLHAASIIPFHARLPRPAQWLLRGTFRRAGLCVVLGEPWRIWVVDRLGVPPERVAVLRNGVPVPRPPQRPRRGFTFLFLGNLLARKGLPDLLHALADPSLRGADWCLMVAGGGDWARLGHLAREMGIGERVRWAGWLDRAGTDAALAGADALVLPSYHEGLPLVLLEAAGLGVPVITTPVGAIPELFSDGETALLVAPGDRVALAAALVRIMTDPVLAARLARNGRALYEREFTMAAFTARLCRLYAGLATGAEVPPA
jgi:glycosyltransferase involved in cell wall biosynthesis